MTCELLFSRAGERGVIILSPTNGLVKGIGTLTLVGGFRWIEESWITFLDGGNEVRVGGELEGVMIELDE